MVVFKIFTFASLMFLVLNVKTQCNLEESDTFACNLSSSQMPSADALAYTLLTNKLDDYSFISRKIPFVSKLMNMSHVIHYNDIQFKIGHDSKTNTIALSFIGTRNYNDVLADLKITHEPINMINIETREHYIINVHGGIKHSVEREITLDEIADELIRISSVNGSAPFTKFVISGSSLGGGFAIYIILMLYGKAADTLYLDRPGFNLLPKNVSDVTCITYGAPYPVFHEDVQLIPTSVSSRVFNFVIYEDPIPLLASGTEGIVKHSINFQRILFAEQRKKFTEAGSNGPIGKYFVLFEYQEKWYKFWRWGKTKNWVKFFDANDKNMTVDYIVNGAECLWNVFASSSKDEVNKIKMLWMVATHHMHFEYIAKVEGTNCIREHLETSDWFKQHNK